MTMDTQEGEKLLPCPFCGSASVRTFAPTCKRGSEYDPTDRAFPIVRCMDCFAEACGENWDNKCKTAINSWNLRDPATPSPALALAQEALRTHCITEMYGEPDGDDMPEIESYVCIGCGESHSTRDGVMHGPDCDIGQALSAAKDGAADRERMEAENDVDWYIVKEAVDDALTDGEGSLHEYYLKYYFAKHGLRLTHQDSAE